MGTEKSSGEKRPNRQYSQVERDKAVRLVFKLAEELGQMHGCSSRVARQLGYRPDTVRQWVRQAEIDQGKRSGVSSEQNQRIKELEQKNRELERANNILREASVFFATELNGQPDK